jgi:enamine deaminase RidA (YjgF/YER057c/UK114 family)
MSTSTTTPINPREMVKPRGYSHGMLSPPGRMLAIAGQIGCDSDGNVTLKDFAAQFGRALSFVLSVLHEAGGVPTDLIALRIFVTDKKQYLAATKEIGLAYRELMGEHYPAMSLVQVADLLAPGALVEIEGLAVLP